MRKLYRSLLATGAILGLAAFSPSQYAACTDQTDASSASVEPVVPTTIMNAAELTAADITPTNADISATLTSWRYVQPAGSVAIMNSKASVRPFPVSGPAPKITASYDFTMNGLAAGANPTKARAAPAMKRILAANARTTADTGLDDFTLMASQRYARPADISATVGT